MTTALEGVRGQRHAPAGLYPRERPGTHCTGGWVGPRAGLDRCGKSRPPPGFDPRTVQPVASRYTDGATRPPYSSKGHSKFVLAQDIIENSHTGHCTWTGKSVNVKVAKVCDMIRYLFTAAVFRPGGSGR